MPGAPVPRLAQPGRLVEPVALGRGLPAPPPGEVEHLGGTRRHRHRHGDRRQVEPVRAGVDHFVPYPEQTGRLEPQLAVHRDAGVLVGRAYGEHGRPAGRTVIHVDAEQGQPRHERAAVPVPGQRRHAEPAVRLAREQGEPRGLVEARRSYGRGRGRRQRSRGRPVERTHVAPPVQHAWHLRSAAVEHERDTG